MTVNNNEVFELGFEILDLHNPEVPPKGMKWLDGTTNAHCEACNGGGDPFLAEDWPCDTANLAFKYLDITAEEWFNRRD